MNFKDRLCAMNCHYRFYELEDFFQSVHKLGMHYVDETLRTRREPLSYIAIGERERREDAAEELRLLYVLLTRARRRLFLVGSLRSAAARLPLYAAMGICPSAAASHLQLMLGALEETKRAGEAPVALVAVHGMDELSAPATEQPRPEATDALDAALRQAGEADAAMAWVYPHRLDSARPVKLTASGLLREAEGPRELPALAERPQFMQEAGMTGAERGSAYHHALQLLELAPLRDLQETEMANAIRAQLDALRQENRLTEAEREVVQPRRLARFFAGETGRRLLGSETVRREWPFNVRMRVAEALGDEADARYGGGRPGEQIALWAYRLGFEHPTRHDMLAFTAPPPNSGAWRDFQDVIKELV